MQKRNVVQGHRTVAIAFLVINTIHGIKAQSNT